MHKAAHRATQEGDPPEIVLRKVRIPLMQRGVLTHQGEAEDVFVVDLGLRGVFVERRDPLEVGETVELRFPLPGNEIPVRASCRVAWWNPAGTFVVSKSLPSGLGLAFVKAHPDDRARIRETLIEQFRRQPRARRFVRQWPDDEDGGVHEDDR